MNQETLSSPLSKLSYCPARGGIITSLCLQGKEILYLDEASFQDTHLNVRGGIPILFPNAGAIEEGHFPGLKQHGFARTSSDWQSAQNTVNTGFTETLETDASTTPEYPFAVRQTLSGILEEDGSATIIQQVTNLESMKSIPVSMGLHPYFNIKATEKCALTFECLGGELIEAAVEYWSNGGTTSIANPRTLDPHASIRVTIPSLGVLTLTASPEYQRIWIWSLPGKDFLCIEPVLRDVGGLVNNPVLVSPSETLSAQFNIKLE